MEYNQYTEKPGRACRQSKRNRLKRKGHIGIFEVNILLWVAVQIETKADTVVD